MRARSSPRCAEASDAGAKRDAGTTVGEFVTKILVGTSSWTDKSLIDSGRFYPASARTAEDRLRYYASQFPIVEIDSSYYGIPIEANARLWVERTPPEFLFNIKAYRLFTRHQTPVASLAKEVRAALGPVTEANIYDEDVPAEIQLDLWRQFRNKSWFDGDRHTGRTLAFERDNGLVNVVVDEPQGIANTIPAVWEVTDPALTVVRLHGRNHRTWNKKGLASSAQRFNYDYDEGELTEVAQNVSTLSRKADIVHVLFNTNYQDQGQRAARMLNGILHSKK
jgi:uncharacterized protein YecE (DUF72 family)